MSLSLSLLLFLQQLPLVMLRMVFFVLSVLRDQLMNSGIPITPTTLCTQSREQRARVSYPSRGHSKDKPIGCDVETAEMLTFLIILALAVFKRVHVDV